MNKKVPLLSVSLYRQSVTASAMVANSTNALTVAINFVRQTESLLTNYGSVIWNTSKQSQSLQLTTKSVHLLSNDAYQKCSKFGNSPFWSKQDLCISMLRIGDAQVFS